MCKLYNSDSLKDPIFVHFSQTSKNPLTNDRICGRIRMYPRGMEKYIAPKRCGLEFTMNLMNNIYRELMENPAIIKAYTANCTNRHCNFVVLVSCYEDFENENTGLVNLKKRYNLYGAKYEVYSNEFCTLTVFENENELKKSYKIA